MSITNKTFENFYLGKFRPGDFSFNDEERSGGPIEVDDDQIKAIIESGRHLTVREIKEMLKINSILFWNEL